jgi:hypothetical protein
MDQNSLFMILITLKVVYYQNYLIIKQKCSDITPVYSEYLKVKSQLQEVFFVNLMVSLIVLQ